MQKAAELYAIQKFPTAISEKDTDKSALNNQNKTVSLEESIKKIYPKPEYQKAVAVFIKLLLQSRDQTFINCTQGDLCKAFESITGYHWSGLNNAVSALNTGNETDFQFRPADLDKIEEMLKLLSTKLEEMKAKM